MQDGLSLNLVINGATLLGVAGLVVKIWLSGRAQKIEQPIKVETPPQEKPVEVKAVFDATPKAQCDERHKTQGAQIDNLFGRVGLLEQRQSANEARVKAINERTISMDGKLDTLLKRK